MVFEWRQVLLWMKLCLTILRYSCDHCLVQLTLSDFFHSVSYWGSLISFILTWWIPFWSLAPVHDMTTNWNGVLWLVLPSSNINHVSYVCFSFWHHFWLSIYDPYFSVCLSHSLSLSLSLYSSFLAIVAFLEVLESSLDTTTTAATIVSLRVLQRCKSQTFEKRIRVKILALLSNNISEMDEANRWFVVSQGLKNNRESYSSSWLRLHHHHRLCFN